MKKSLLLVTDLTNGDEQEDLFFRDALAKHFTVSVSSLEMVREHEDHVDCILLKNAWPHVQSVQEMKGYRKMKEGVLQRFREKNLVTYNHLSGRGDAIGKDHLFELYESDFPVIPSFRDYQASQQFACDQFFLKPRCGLSSVGTQIKKKEDLTEEDFFDNVVQEYMHFAYEVSFYFIDGVFAYALYAPDTEERWQLKKYSPTDEELLWSENFVEWNTLEYGFQRIDACKTKDGKLLLMEIEDDYPFWSFLDLDQKTQKIVFDNFLASLQKNCF